MDQSDKSNNSNSNNNNNTTTMMYRQRMLWPPPSQREASNETDDNIVDLVRVIHQKNADPSGVWSPLPLPTASRLCYSLSQNEIIFDPTVFGDDDRSTQQVLANSIVETCGGRCSIKVKEYSSKDRKRIRFQCATGLENCTLTFQVNFNVNKEYWFIKRNKGNFVHTCGCGWMGSEAFCVPIPPYDVGMEGTGAAGAGALPGSGMTRGFHTLIDEDMPIPKPKNMEKQEGKNAAGPPVGKNTAKNNNNNNNKSIRHEHATAASRLALLSSVACAPAVAAAANNNAASPTRIEQVIAAAAALPPPQDCRQQQQETSNAQQQRPQQREEPPSAGSLSSAKKVQHRHLDLQQLQQEVQIQLREKQQRMLKKKQQRPSQIFERRVNRKKRALPTPSGGGAGRGVDAAAAAASRRIVMTATPTLSHEDTTVTTTTTAAAGEQQQQQQLAISAAYTAQMFAQHRSSAAAAAAEATLMAASSNFAPATTAINNNKRRKVSKTHNNNNSRKPSPPKTTTLCPPSHILLIDPHRAPSPLDPPPAAAAAAVSKTAAAGTTINTAARPINMGQTTTTATTIMGNYRSNSSSDTPPPPPPPPPPPQQADAAAMDDGSHVSLVASEEDDDESEGQEQLDGEEDDDDVDSSNFWMTRYNDLKVYYQRHGHCLVPQNYPANRSLGVWVKNQRSQYKQLQNNGRSSLTPIRIAMLERIQFRWRVSGGSNSAISSNNSKTTTATNKKKRPKSDWHTKFEEVEAYSETHGSAEDLKLDRPQLWRWLSEQRRQYNLLSLGLPAKLDREQIFLLERLDKEWPLTPKPQQQMGAEAGDDDWANGFSQMQAFYQEHGHCIVPPPTEQDTPNSLPCWVKKQQEQFKLFFEGKPTMLTPERIRLLEQIKFCWFGDWMEMYEQLSDHFKLHGNCFFMNHHHTTGDTPKSSLLKRWVQEQREQFQLYIQCCRDQQPTLRCILNKQRIQLLEDLDFEWDAEEAQWMAGYVELGKFVRLHGIGVFPEETTARSTELCEWVTEQQGQFGSGSPKLTKRRYELLDLLGFPWKTDHLLGDAFDEENLEQHRDQRTRAFSAM